MTTPDPRSSLEFSRRKLLAAAGIGGGALLAASLGADVDAATPASPLSDPVTTPPVAGLHLQFGADASSEMVVSWHTLQPVRNPRVVLGRLDGKFEQTAEAEAVSYTDAKSGQIVYAYHAKLARLEADSAYLYGAMHDGAEPEFATFRTSPRGRAPFTFTSFGDQGTPTLGKKFMPPAGMAMPNPPYVNDNLGSPAAGDTTLGVERLQPLFHLFNGDLCYANLAEDRVRTWWDFWQNNSRSACKPPRMPSPGNHENELDNDSALRWFPAALSSAPRAAKGGRAGAASHNHELDVGECRMQVADSRLRLQARRLRFASKAGTVMDQEDRSPAPGS